MSLTREQFYNRRTGLGGSDIGAICNESRFATPLKVYNDKVCDKSYEEYMIEYDNQQQDDLRDLGNMMEDVIAKKFTRKTGLETIRDDITHRHHHHDFLIGNVDGWVKDQNIIVEWKTAQYESDSYGEEYSNIVPPSYYLQAAHYRMITGADKVMFGVLFLGSGAFKIYEYTPNEKLEQNVMSIAVNFWNNHVLKRVPPDPVFYSEAAQLYKDKQQKKIITSDAFDLIKDFERLKEEEKQLSSRIDSVKTELAKYMGNANLLVDEAGNKILKWSEVTRNVLDTSKIKEYYPDVYNENIAQRVTRRFQTFGVTTR